MAIFNSEDVIAFENEDGMFCLECAQNRGITNFMPVLDTEIEYGMTASCDCICCEKILYVA